MERGGETLSDSAFVRISQMAMAIAGIMLPDSKRDMVRSRLARRVRVTGCVDFEEYCDALEADPQHPERRELISALTTNVTRFMREPHHFEELERVILPELGRRRAGGRIRFWSAGCSSGEEPYSMAVCVGRTQPSLMNADFRILATDIDDRILAAARAGRYPAEALDALPVDARARYFDIDDGVACAGEALRSVIAFKQLNLIQDWPMSGPFQAIFCRNVLIYFNAATQREIVRKFSELLEPGGALFLGHSERVDSSLEPRFERAGMTSYRRK